MSKVVFESALWLAVLVGELTTVLVVMVRSPRTELADDHGASWAGPAWGEPLTAPMPAVAAVPAMAAVTASPSPAARHAGPAQQPVPSAAPALPARERYQPRHGEPAISGQPPWPPAPRPAGLTD